MTTYPGDFEEQIRDLLTNLYDYLRLINNPLAQQLTADLSGNERVIALRGTILDAIEALKSENKAGLTSRQNRLYNILVLRYVEEQTTTETLNQLALSERQYYREHQRALRTISQIIWDRHFGDKTDAEDDTQSLIEELDHLQSAARNQIFYPKEEILTAIKATRVIAERQGVAVRLDDDAEPVLLNLAQPLFRQFIILILNQLIGATPAGGRISIQVRLWESTPGLAIGIDQPRFDWEGFGAGLRADAALQELMKRLNATMSIGGALTLRFDQEIQKILIVDDNPDTISLFNRYLANLPYQLLSAAQEREAMRIAQTTPLCCIILDIMLPGKDGWQILQTTKSHPLTEHIPVLICSVLEMRELALSLGADGYIKKPPTRDEFLSTLEQWLG